MEQATAIQELNLDKSNWKKVKLGDVVKEVRNNTKDPVKEGLKRVVSLADIEPENIHLESWNDLADGTSFKRKFAAGQVLFGRRRAYLKKAALATFEGLCSGDIIVMEAKEGLNPKLLPFLINNDSFFDYAVENSAGSLSPRAKFKDLANYQFLLPPKDQQARLAALLWAMDEVVEKEKQVLERLEVVNFVSKENIFLRGNGAIELKSFGSYKIPKLWEVKKMSEVATVEYGISKSVANNTDPNLGWQILTGANINLDGSFNLEKKRYIEIPENDRFFLEQGDLMFNWRSGSPEHIGKTAIFNLNGNYTYASFILRIRCGEKVMNRYLFYLLNHLREVEYFTKNIAQQVNFKINATIFREIDMPIPSIEEQTKILKVLEEYHKLKGLVVIKISQSQALQKALINQIFS